MKVIIAPDSFKGSLTAAEVADALASGFQRVFPNTEFVKLPIADGGEGTLDNLIAAAGGTEFASTVAGPLGEARPARWGLLADRETAVVELAQAAGLTLLPPESRDPRNTNTYGVGEQIAVALSYPGVRRLIIALGGSATNDAGSGLMRALGVRLLDGRGAEITRGGGAALRDVAEVVCPDWMPGEGVEILIACDVDNPLCGPRGASAVFGPQKGATPNDVAELDAALRHFAEVLAKSGRDISEIPGSGAAGGAAAGLLYLFPHAQLRPGIEIVLDAVRFETVAFGADLILTGEGRLDAQTFGGKAIAGIARRARKLGVPVAAIVGGILGDARQGEILAERLGVDASLSIVPGPCTLDDAVANARAWTVDAAERAARWVQLGRKM